MKASRQFWCWVLPALAGLVLLLPVFFLFHPRVSIVTPENFAKIQEGMTEEEVKAILGPPESIKEHDQREEGSFMLKWTGHEGQIYVQFLNSNRRVLEAHWLPPDPSFWDEIVHRLGL